MLPATASPCARFKTNGVVESLRERNLKLLQTDKEGGFAVLPSDLYYRKAQKAMDDNFVRTNLVPHSLRKRAIELCENANLPRLQQPVGRFIQKALSALEIEDPFLVFRRSEVSDFLKGLSPGSGCVFSLDVKDLYYSLPQDELIEVVSEGIDRYGTVRFQNEVGVDVSTFLAVLRLYLQSPTVEFLGGVYLQRAGVCIGSCVARVLSNLLLARYDRRLERALRDMGVPRVFRFIDDYLILFDTENVAVDERTEHITRIFQRTLSPFTLTEVPVEHRLRFLDLEPAIEPDHLCWTYAPRSKKGLLPFSSAHSKLVKRSIALSAMENAVKRSCTHQVQRSLLPQVLRLKTAGFPVQLIRGLAEVLLGKLHKKHEEAPRHDRSSSIAAIPYIHAVSHNIKKVAQRAGVSVVFTAPNKLGGLCRHVNSEEAAASVCNKKHIRPFVQCKCNVIYDIPLTCGKSYVGQTGRCLNDRLREHSSSLQTHTGSNLAMHCRDCRCRPCLEETRVLRSYSDRLAREIYEGAQIHNRGEKCVSKPSVDQLNKEISYLLECS
ncbi:uncharacterized protein LOC135392540 [Ornithodoros turicata]|uniref:uncharacterized protein LOC135392540 n=1 Tax=Ornithodoros turicata TaxID=34597 RepID=UPI0031399AE5